MLEAETPLTRAAYVAEKIELAILRGELAAGERIIEGELARQLDVSKTPIREALRMLARKGVVTTTAYRGTIVRQIGPESARNLFEVRLLLEPDAVARAVRHHDAESLRSCREALLAANSAGSGEAELGDRSVANRRFHQSLYAKCENPYLREILDDLQDQVAMVSVSRWRRNASWREEAGEHEAILAAVEDGDAALAFELVRGHISSFLGSLQADH